MSNCLKYFNILENIYATLPKTQRGQPLVLGGDPKGKNFLYTNGNSVIIRNIAVSSWKSCLKNLIVANSKNIFNK